jgi:hypothetical protein
MDIEVGPHHFSLDANPQDLLAVEVAEEEDTGKEVVGDGIVETKTHLASEKIRLEES